MSYNTHKNWAFSLYGKSIKLWQIATGASIVELDGYKMRLPADFQGKQLVYPTETITNGLMFEGTAFIEPFINEDPNVLDGGSGNDNPSLTPDTTPSVADNRHVNCTRMNALAIVDFIKAQIAEKSNNIEMKEYFMKEFWGKVADNKSNRIKISVSIPSSPYSVV